MSKLLPSILLFVFALLLAGCDLAGAPPLSAAEMARNWVLNKDASNASKAEFERRHDQWMKDVSREEAIAWDRITSSIRRMEEAHRVADYEWARRLAEPAAVTIFDELIAGTDFHRRLALSGHVICVLGCDDNEVRGSYDGRQRVERSPQQSEMRDRCARRCEEEYQAPPPSP
jgi:hypothetical protein